MWPFCELVFEVKGYSLHTPPLSTLLSRQSIDSRRESIRSWRTSVYSDIGLLLHSSPRTHAHVIMCSTQTYTCTRSLTDTQPVFFLSPYILIYLLSVLLTSKTSIPPEWIMIQFFSPESQIEHHIARAILYKMSHVRYPFLVVANCCKFIQMLQALRGVAELGVTRMWTSYSARRL